MNYLNKLTKILYLAAAALMPSILLFRLYNQNYAHNYILFSNVLFIAGLLAVIGILVFFFFKWITGTIDGALLTSGMLWVSFWLFGAIMGRVRIFFPAMPNAALVAVLYTFIAAAALLLRTLSKQSKDKQAKPETAHTFAAANTPDGMIDTLLDDKWRVTSGR